MSSPTPSLAPSSSKDDSRVPDALNVPENIQIKLHLRKGTPLVQCRSTKDLPDPPSWGHNWERDSFSILCARIRECVPADLPGVEWSADALPYVKPTRHSAGRSYQQLDEHNFVDRLKKAWRMEERRLGDVTKIVVPIFAYLTNPETRSAVATHLLKIKDILHYSLDYDPIVPVEPQPL
ncbi:hypothetical protein BGZ58_001444 [Dissophora ornata]|nr:hypothetical protein BGZ58_001444 [Dissophora ornata]